MKRINSNRDERVKLTPKRKKGSRNTGQGDEPVSSRLRSKTRKTMYSTKTSDSGEVTFVSEAPCCSSDVLERYKKLSLDSALFLQPVRRLKKEQSHISIITVSSDEDPALSEDLTSNWVAALNLSGPNSMDEEEHYSTGNAKGDTEFNPNQTCETEKTTFQEDQCPKYCEKQGSPNMNLESVAEMSSTHLTCQTQVVSPTPTHTVTLETIDQSSSIWDEQAIHDSPELEHPTTVTCSDLHSHSPMEVQAADNSIMISSSNMENSHQVPPPEEDKLLLDDYEKNNTAKSETVESLPTLFFGASCPISDISTAFQKEDMIDSRFVNETKCFASSSSTFNNFVKGSAENILSENRSFNYYPEQIPSTSDALVELLLDIVPDFEEQKHQTYYSSEFDKGTSILPLSENKQDVDILKKNEDLSSATGFSTDLNSNASMEFQVTEDSIMNSSSNMDSSNQVSAFLENQILLDHLKNNNTAKPKIVENMQNFFFGAPNTICDISTAFQDEGIIDDSLTEEKKSSALGLSPFYDEFLDGTSEHLFSENRSANRNAQQIPSTSEDPVGPIIGNGFGFEEQTDDFEFFY